MKASRSKRRSSLILALATLVVAVGLAAPAAGQDFTCLPTCKTDDAKFLTIAGDGRVTLSADKLDVTLYVPAEVPVGDTFVIGVFDGDGGVRTPFPPAPFIIESRWDLGPDPVDYEYRP